MLRLATAIVVGACLGPATAAWGICPDPPPDYVPAGPASVTATPNPAPSLTAVTLTSSGTRPHDCVVYALAHTIWTFGDGSSTSTASATTDHSYRHSGTYMVTVVRDYSDGTSTDVSDPVSVTITNRPPVAQIADPGLVRTGRSVAFSSAGSEDPDGSIASYLWGFGDGGTGNGASPTHTFASRGIFSVSLSLLDDDVGLGSTSRDVTVRDLPVAGFTATGDAPSAGSVTLDGGSSTADPALSLASYGWSFGDGSPPVTATSPTTTHAYAGAGTYVVTLTVTDSTGATAVHSGAVTVSAAPAPAVLPATLDVPSLIATGSPAPAPRTTTKSPPGCVVPALKGKTLAAARKALTRARCSVGKVSHRRARHSSVGRVISSAPKARTKLRSRSKVALVVGKR